MNDSKKGFVHNVRQSVLTTLVLLLICGFLFPVVLTGLSAVMFPHQAGGSLLTTADGTAVGAQNVGQDFTQPYFMKGRPSAYQYNTYYEDEEGNQFYNDGTEFAGLSSGSNNYGPSNPALAERVQADIEEFLAAGMREKADDHFGHPPFFCLPPLSSRWRHRRNFSYSRSSIISCCENISVRWRWS